MNEPIPPEIMRSLRAFLAAGKSGEVVLFASRGQVQRAELNEVVVPKQACSPSG